MRCFKVNKHTLDQGLISLSPITTIFELAQGFTHSVHIDKCSEAQFKFGVHLGCKTTWSTGTTDYQSALEQRLVIEPTLETNNQLIRSCYYWGGEDGTEVGDWVEGVGWGN